MKRLFYLFFLAMVFLGVPQSVFATDSIGVSPSKIWVEIYPGRTETQSVFLSRSNTNGEAVFDIQVEGDPLVDLGGLETATIPEGQNSTSVEFTVDPKDIANGDYVVNLIFILRNPPDLDGANSARIQSSITQAINVSVTNPPSAAEPVDVRNHLFFLDDIVLSRPKIQTTKTDAGQVLHITWSEQNTSANALHSLPVMITIARHDSEPYERETVNEAVIAAGETVQHTFDYPIAASYPSGTYNVTIVAGENKLTTSVWILQPKLRQQLSIVIAALILAVLATLGILLFDRHRNPKRLKPRHNRS